MNDRLVAHLLVVLAAAAGCLDAVCVARLGGPFASVITGNQTAALLTLATAAASMGVQSVVTLASGLSQASTTYLTGTPTGIIRDLIEAPRRYASSLPGAYRLVALLCGATAGAQLLRIAPLWTPALSAALVAAVLATVLWSSRG